MTPSLCSVLSISLPLVLAQAGKSAKAPGSEVTASTTWPISTSLTWQPLEIHHLVTSQFFAHFNPPSKFIRF